MEENTQDVQNENQVEPELPPVVKDFTEPTRKFFYSMDNFSDKWDDASSAHFKDEVVNHSRKVTYDYILSVLQLVNEYDFLLQQAERLLDWNAGFGSRLSLMDIGMLVQRQSSRLLLGRDYHRW